VAVQRPALHCLRVSKRDMSCCLASSDLFTYITMLALSESCYISELFDTQIKKKITFGAALANQPNYHYHYHLDNPKSCFMFSIPCIIIQFL
jgi:hypothetical protein